MQHAVALALFVGSSAAVKADKEDWYHSSFNGVRKPQMHMNCAGLPDPCINWAKWCAWTYQQMGQCNICGPLVQSGDYAPCQDNCAGCSGANSQAFSSSMGAYAESAAKTTPPPAPVKPSVGGDPFVVDSHGNKVQFFMPLGQEKQLLACDTWKLYGSSFGTGIANDHQQWFDHLRFAHEQNENELVMGIARNETKIPDEADISAPQDATKALSILDLKIAGTKVSTTGAVATDNACLAAVWKTAEAETVQFSCSGMVLQIKTALAQKFTEKKEQLLYTHLDMRFLELQSSTCKAGILAEIWGIAPMSQETANMLLAPQ